MKFEFNPKLSRRWVVKVGSSIVTNNGTALNVAAIAAWAAQIAQLRHEQKEVVLVSSGAVAEGMRRLGWSRRPQALHDLQAAAAVGQMGLVQAYESAFQRFGLHTAQILLTHAEIRDRQQYLNARSTLRTLVQLGVIPIINENDTVATEEIKLGDNDNLAAMVANLVEADLLVLLTDQAGLYEQDPRTTPKARRIETAKASDPALDDMAGGSPGHLGRGGMITKIQAARRAARSGATTLITSGLDPEILKKIALGEAHGTWLLPDRAPLAARKQWLASQLQVRGRLILDEGATRVVREKGSSLLPVGVKAVEGEFARGDLVACVSPEGVEIARGLSNYNAAETRLIMGQPSQRIEVLLGYVDEPELIHRDDMILL